MCKRYYTGSKQVNGKKRAVKKQGDGRDFQKKKGKEKKEIVD